VDAYAGRIVDTLADRGYDIRPRIVFRRVVTPADLEDVTATPGGAIYGTPSHALLRPSARGPVRGMFLVGGSTHPGGGLPLVALSAEIAARRIGPA
jgi:phytoene dehydrogenase-like protein